MIQLIWGILNLLLILSFFYLLIGLVVKGSKFLEPYPKLITVPILVFGVVGILGNKAGKEKQMPVYKGLATLDEFELSKNLTNRIHLILVRDKDSREIFHEGSFSNISGFMMGLEWEHLGIVEHENELEVRGRLTYRFLGIDAFSSNESFVLKDFNLSPD